MQDTLFYLMARNGYFPVVPLDVVAKDMNLTPDKLARKISSGEIKLPLVRLGESQKAVKGVPVTDYAKWLDAQMESARKEARQLSG